MGFLDNDGVARLAAKLKETFSLDQISQIISNYSSLSSALNQTQQNIASIESSTAQSNHAVGSCFILNNVLYKTTVAIAAGEEIVSGTNVTPVTIDQLISCPYPVGDILMRQNDNNPANDWPGTSWTEIGQGRFPVGANSSYGNGRTGDPTHTHGMQNHTHGMKNHVHGTGDCTLNVNQIPGHSHGVAIVAGSGSISRNAQTASNGGWKTAGTKGVLESYTTSVGGGGAHNHGNTGGPSNNTSDGPSNNTTTASTAVPPWFGVRFWKRTA